MLEKVLLALLYVLPAYVANATPVPFAKILKKTTPIDGGRFAWDGRRILGDGKSWEGLLLGIAGGTLIGVILYLAGNLGGFRSISEPMVLSVGAMIGDVFGSFIKRRIGLKRGEPAPGLDQLGFLIIALMASVAIYGVPDWFDSMVFACILIITAILHLSTNFIAYLLKLKDRPY